ncbi:Yip1 domain protein [Trichuris suis]|nr:Yip1 domain protein [Trichuris suis]
MEPPEAYRTAKSRESQLDIFEAESAWKSPQKSEPSQDDNFNVHLTKMVFEASSKQIKRAVSTYTNVDLLRCYFDVTPSEVVHQLVASLNPLNGRLALKYDLYGPLMLVFTLVALLLHSMKNSNYVVKDRTLIGTAFATTIGYWFLASLCLLSVSIWLSTSHTPVVIGSIVTHLIVGLRLVCSLSGTGRNRAASLFGAFPFFLPLSFLDIGLAFDAPAGIKPISGKIRHFYSRSLQPFQKLALATLITLLNIGFLYYLHFGFHKVLEGKVGGGYIEPIDPPSKDNQSAPLSKQIRNRRNAGKRRASDHSKGANDVGPVTISSRLDDNDDDSGGATRPARSLIIVGLYFKAHLARSETAFGCLLFAWLIETADIDVAHHRLPLSSLLLCFLDWSNLRDSEMTSWIGRYGCCC